MTYFNKIKERAIHLRGLRGSFCGEFRMVTYKGYEFPRGSGIVWKLPGSTRIDTGWMPNLITDQGLDRYGLDSNNNGMDYCHVGTGNTAPVNSDTGLVTWVAAAADISATASAATSAPYFGSLTRKYRFNPNFGGGNVNLNEVGAGWSATNGNLSSRALTVDGAGTPTTISVLADEYLDVYYRRRNYPAHLTEATGAPNDLTGTVDISGTSYGYTVRPALVTFSGTADGQIGWGSVADKTCAVHNGFNIEAASTARLLAYNATIAAVTSYPTLMANSGQTASGFASSYSLASYTRDLYWQWGISTGNDANGIGGLLIKGGMGMYQLIFDTPVLKVEGEVFTWYHTYSWDRKTTWV